MKIMNKTCKYYDYTYPGHTSSEHHEPPEMQMCDLISKVRFFTSYKILREYSYDTIAELELKNLDVLKVGMNDVIELGE